MLRKTAKLALLHPLAKPYTNKLTNFLMRTTEVGAKEKKRVAAKSLAPAKDAIALVGDISQGVSIEDAFLNYIRSAFKSGQRVVARSFAMSLLNDEKSRYLGDLCCGVYFYYEGLHETAIKHFDATGYSTARTHCPLEFFSVLIASDANKGFLILSDFLDNELLSGSYQIRADLLNLFAKHLHIVGLKERVDELLKAIELNKGVLTEKSKTQLIWLATVLDSSRSDFSHQEDAKVTIGVMDYKALDYAYTSSNHGDYVQTLAALSNICRFSNVEYDQNTELGMYMTQLQGLVSEERKLGGGRVKADLVIVDRDFSSGRNYPKNTWLVSNAWYMHRNFKGDFDIPFSSNINPIYVSVHINTPDLLTPEAVSHFKQHEPIGCRDWTTVYRLRDHGVSAFFTGCLTTTVGQIFPKPAGANTKQLAVVEAKPGHKEYVGFKKENFVQVETCVRDTPLVESLSIAYNMLSKYLRFSHVVTSRLHCYLPCRSIGLKVDFRPKNLADVRFEGLLNLNDEQFLAIRNGLEVKLEELFKLIFAGADVSAVRKRWMELCADEVSFAETYCQTYPPLPKPSFNISDVVQSVKQRVAVCGPTSKKENIHVALAVDENLSKHVPTLLASILDNTETTLSVHILTRGLSMDFIEKLSRKFNTISFNQYDFSDVHYGEKLSLLKHTTVSTIDRMLLPELLTNLDRIVYLDIDTLVLGDLAELHNLEMGEKVLAGKLSQLDSWNTAVKLVTKSSLKLEASAAAELRRRMHANGSLAIPTFNAGVLLMNLCQMRIDEFCLNYIPLVECYAMNDQDALNVYARTNIVVLNTEWNAVPSQDYCPDPKIIHWAGMVKPWGRLYVSKKEEFDHYSAETSDVLM